MCGCGYETPTHKYKDMDGLRVHELGEGGCCRMIASGDLEPTNFRMEVWSSHIGTKHEKTFLTEVCDVNGITITKYTLTDQRGYSYNEELGVWTLPKDKSSINSIGDNW